MTDALRTELPMSVPLTPHDENRGEGLSEQPRL